MCRVILLACMLPCAAAPPGQTPPAAEMQTQDAPVPLTFTSRVNLVPVTVVVRDGKGRAVGNLTKEDFRLLNNGKLQGNRPLRLRSSRRDSELTCSMTCTFASGIWFRSVTPPCGCRPPHFSRRTGSPFCTTSGQTTLEFTADQAKMQETLRRLRLSPTEGGTGTKCPDIGFFMADLIIN